MSKSDISVLAKEYDCLLKIRLVEEIRLFNREIQFFTRKKKVIEIVKNN
jgi:hypothetical protein